MGGGGGCSERNVLFFFLEEDQRQLSPEKVRLASSESHPSSPPPPLPPHTAFACSPSPAQLALHPPSLFFCVGVMGWEFFLHCQKVPIPLQRRLTDCRGARGGGKRGVCFFAPFFVLFGGREGRSFFLSFFFLVDWMGKGGGGCERWLLCLVWRGLNSRAHVCCVS